MVLAAGPLLAACSSGSSGDGNEAAPPASPAPPPEAPRPGVGPIAFVDVAAEAGLDFRHGAFRWG